MTESWANTRIGGVDLHLDLRGPGAVSGLRAGLMDALREAVRGGRLAPGTRLPSSRTLAADLGVARNTVADAYGALVAEGWLTARQGSGTRVAARAVPARPAPRRGTAGAAGAPVSAAAPHPAAADRPAYSLLPGFPDLSAFPRAAWVKATRRALSVAPYEAFACAYDETRGRIELRTALAGYLARTRGVDASPERIVVCSGSAHGLMLLGKVLRARRVRGVAVDAYGLPAHRDLLAAAGLRTPALPLDARGSRTEVLADLAGAPAGVGAVLLTPAHQFPTGGALHPERRAAAVDWARAAGGLILEDDYDGEFRYDGQSVGALQGLDPERVVFMGTASKSLAPGLRLAWMVLPRGLVAEVAAAKGQVDWASSTLEQLTLAEFIASGAYDRHIRAMRARYRRRRNQLVDALAELAPDIRVTGIAAGLHAVVRLPPGTERETLAVARRRGLRLEGLSGFRHPADPSPPYDALVVGYGTPSDSAWTGALDALRRVLPSRPSHPSLPPPLPSSS
ncbi:MocR-like pyridoxine biosynthesis transcription factor PdxR [Streptomyces paludis]|uniref:PLP-dependent aminotransferase family protein n=1 Tax=Streptomyces paludis TaxID=2282738 RepID=A0A345HT09_9ACTN|nr:PLP-dependent aminotransferase family protein [Streptomyces paludis]AXG79833.1 PLP-dependent aminotransferase family protein [Streptomyces paludis]